ncbi:MAG: 30S ribosomal protein THX [Cytophagales bacterium]|nr:30S ribosomal protein THX [Cytophagales bacterium]
MGRGDVKTRKGKLFRGSFGNKRQRKTNKSVKPILQSNEKKLQRNKIAPVKPKLDPITTSQDEEVKKEIQPKLDPVSSIQDKADKKHPDEIVPGTRDHREKIQQGREEKEILEKEKIKGKTESAKSTVSDQIDKEKKPTTLIKPGQDKPDLNNPGYPEQQSSPPEKPDKPDKSGSTAKAEKKSDKESK